MSLVPSESSAQIEDQELFAEPGNEVAFELYKQLQPQPGNLFFSPFSVRMALAMTYAGARGETAAEMRKALGFASQLESLHGAASAIITRLNSAASGVSVANSLWGQDGAPLKKEFLDLVDRYYDGAMRQVDFRNSAETARATINHWVEEKTQQRIRELINPKSLTPDTRLVLVNAMHFKGTWDKEFQRDATNEAPFYLDDGREVRAAQMAQSERFKYMETPDFQAVELDYLKSDISMLVLLPVSKNSLAPNGLAPLQDRLSARLLRDIVARLEAREVHLFLPAFKITWGTHPINSLLQGIGVSLAFDRAFADFSGMNGFKAPHADALFISDVLHKAFIEVNEEGTEAAAATVVEMDDVASNEPDSEFRADHPFLFAIRDKISGAILFLGRMSDPTLPQ